MRATLFELVVDRMAAGIVGFFIGVVVALGLFVFVMDVDAVWILIATPFVCAALAMAFGDVMLDVLKQVASVLGRLAWW